MSAISGTKFNSYETSSSNTENPASDAWEGLAILAKCVMEEVESVTPSPKPIKWPRTITTPQSELKCEKCGWITIQLKRFEKHRGFDPKTNTYAYACEKVKNEALQNKAYGVELQKRTAPPSIQFKPQRIYTFKHFSLDSPPPSCSKKTQEKQPIKSLQIGLKRLREGASEENMGERAAKQSRKISESQGSKSE